MFPVRYLFEDALDEAKKATRILFRLNGGNLGMSAVLHRLSRVSRALLYSVPSQDIYDGHEIDFLPWALCTNK